MVRLAITRSPLRAACCAAALLAFPAAVDAQELINADRPGIADGSQVVGRRAVQVETGLQWQREEAVRAWTLPTLARVGLGDRLEFRVEGNTFTRESGVSGFAPISLGANVLLVSEDEDRPTVGSIVRVFPRSGSTSFATEHVTGDARLALDVPLGGKLSLNPNLGVGRYEQAGDMFSAGLFAMTLNYTPTERLNPFVDVGYQSATGRGEGAATVIDAGVAWIIGVNVQLDISAGQTLRGDGPRPFVAGGLSVRLRPNR